MKISINPAKYEVLIKQHLRSVLQDISVFKQIKFLLGYSVDAWFILFCHETPISIACRSVCFFRLLRASEKLDALPGLSFCKLIIFPSMSIISMLSPWKFTIVDCKQNAYQYGNYLLLLAGHGMPWNFCCSIRLWWTSLSLPFFLFNMVLISSFFEINFEIKTNAKKSRRFDLSEVISSE